MLARRYAEAACCHRQDLDIVLVHQQFGRRAAIGAVVRCCALRPSAHGSRSWVAACRDSMITLPPLACMARTSRTQATPGCHRPASRSRARSCRATSGRADRRRRYRRRSGRNHRLADQADGADHPGQSDRSDSEQDGADATDLLSSACHDVRASSRLRPLFACQPTIAGDGSQLMKSLGKNSCVKSRIEKKKSGAEAPPRVWGGVQERGESG